MTSKTKDKENNITKFRKKRAEMEKGGEPEKIEKQHQAGKMTARERIQALFDHDSFMEIQSFVQHRCTQFD
ncbi:MAG TPA: carboxyl transferase domain-containing protein, partial [Candidatus Deferrimicrobium sp.]|nr:carboxyl transferase domain-containing protein [Candidatus Deferrimicrobium sp.]